jgi:hypothetical protein
VVVVADPLRLRFGKLTVATLALAAGTAIPDPGRSFRIQITLARVEWSF